MTDDYYRRMFEAKEKIAAAVLPSEVRIGYVGTCYGALNVTWYFGQKETGFAVGSTPEAVINRVLELVFGGL